MMKLFSDLGVDSVFILNGIEYKKVQEVRISCCRSINAVAVGNDGNKIQVTPNTEVEINDQL
jgi:hypothetical protein